MFDGPRAVHDAGHPERPLVIAYYTIDTPYQHEAETLKASLEAVGYSYDIRGIPNLGNWQKNTRIKAWFVQHMLGQYPGQPLLYLDVDAIMVKPPTMLNNGVLDADVAAAYFCGKRAGELLSGTVWWGNTPKCHEVVNRWIAISERFPVKLPNGQKAWDQRTLKRAIKEIEGCNFFELPTEYTYITELTQRHRPELNPVILHTRGAKRFSRIVDGKKGYEK